jgi:hypothetical protein
MRCKEPRVASVVSRTGQGGGRRAMVTLRCQDWLSSSATTCPAAPPSSRMAPVSDESLVTGDASGPNPLGWLTRVFVPVGAPVSIPGSATRAPNTVSPPNRRSGRWRSFTDTAEACLPSRASTTISPPGEMLDDWWELEALPLADVGRLRAPLSASFAARSSGASGYRSSRRRTRRCMHCAPTRAIFPTWV